MAKRGNLKPLKTYLILEEYLQNVYTIPHIAERLEEHLNGHKFELGKPFTVTLIPVKGSAFYLLEGTNEADEADDKNEAAETFMADVCGG